MAILVAGATLRCDRNHQENPAKAAPTAPPAVDTRPWTAPKPRDLTSLDDGHQRSIELTRAQTFPDCHRLFEPDGDPADIFPLVDVEGADVEGADVEGADVEGAGAQGSDAEQAPLALAGCGPEAYRVLDDGTRYVGYAVAPPDGGPGWDMRVSAYAPSGQLDWSYRIDRGANADNFTANFRQSFITPLLPRLVCAGTLWQGGTQMACVDADTGKPKWHGTMPFWSAIVPQGHETTVTAATINGLSRRYPYSGVEMRLKSFDVAGGRTAYYATDSKAVFFVGESTDSPHMTAYDIGSLEPRWRLALPARPQPTWTYAFEAFGVVLFEINQHVYAADTDTGQVLWAAQVGADQPPVAAVGESLYMLIRRETEANQLVKIEPRSGDIGWRAAVPTGSLDIMSYDDALMLRSVRAVQKVVDLE